MLEAVGSVEAQTRHDYIHLVQPDTCRSWNGRYPPAVYYNEQAKVASAEDYISWLSDDDLLLPNYIADLADYLDTHPEAECVYGGSRHVRIYPNLGEQFIRNLPEELPFPILSNAYTPGWRIDGGQFMIRRSALEKVTYPYYPEDPDPSVARVCDALFMNKIVQAMTMYPIQVFVMVNRMTSLGSHVAIDSLGRAQVQDWRSRTHA